MDVSIRRAAPDRNRELTLLLGGAAFFRAVVAAHRLGLFTELAARPGAKREALAAALALPDISVRALLMTCQALGWVVQDEDGGYRNQPWVGATFAGASAELPAVLEAFDQLMYRPFGQLEDALRAGSNAGLECFPGPGRTLYERLTVHPQLERVFHSWMSNLSSQGLPARLVEAFSGCSHVLDVGGGDGTNAVLLARAHPQLRVTVLDLPSVCARVEQRAADEGLSSRIGVHPCDIREGNYPGGADGVLFSRIFNIYSAAQNGRFVAHAARALAPGGRLVVFPSSVSDDDGGGPLPAAFLSLYFLCIATGEGRVYAPAEYEGWFRDAGFSSLSCTVDGNDEAVFVGLR